MNGKKYRKLCIALLTANVLFIWGNSLLTAPISAAFSRFVGKLLGQVFGLSGAASGSGHGLLRKIAHVTEFACLGMCLRWFASMEYPSRLQRIGIPLVAGILVACVDETIQIFVPGRGPGLKDVMIDTLGLTLGVVIISLIYYFNHKKTEEDNT